jgi:hypothetical protein
MACFVRLPTSENVEPSSCGESPGPPTASSFSRRWAKATPTSFYLRGSRQQIGSISCCRRVSSTEAFRFGSHAFSLPEEAVPSKNSDLVAALGFAIRGTPSSPGTIRLSVRTPGGRILLTRAFCALLRFLLCSRAALVAENLALRHQLARSLTVREGGLAYLASTFGLMLSTAARPS